VIVHDYDEDVPPPFASGQTLKGPDDGLTAKELFTNAMARSLELANSKLTLGLLKQHISRLLGEVESEAKVAGLNVEDLRKINQTKLTEELLGKFEFTFRAHDSLGRFGKLKMIESSFQLPNGSELQNDVMSSLQRTITWMEHSPKAHDQDEPCQVHTSTTTLSKILQSKLLLSDDLFICSDGVDTLMAHLSSSGKKSQPWSRSRVSSLLSTQGVSP